MEETRQESGRHAPCKLNARVTVSSCNVIRRSKMLCVGGWTLASTLRDRTYLEAVVRRAILRRRIKRKPLLIENLFASKLP
jgi:hypothetical protein